MAAISALMISEDTLQKENHDGDRTPTTSKPAVRVRSPQPADVVTLPDRQPSEPRAMEVEVTANQNTQDTKKAKREDAPVPTMQRQERKRSNSDAISGDGSDEEPDGSDKDDEQDEEDGSGGRKKKGQRFFCTGYPPCNLSFTRSEHLARHIRKHTGERPFQCHCNRRFSRLDNLRQHAQTVHVNEEIPGDSLAATGTRYQRQIRTDRVRPSPRPRTSTMSSTGSHSRGHSRNLSTSSIGSTSSIYSNATDVRRRPPPLLMANDNRPVTPPTYSNYSAHSPGDMSTPTSVTFPATPSSPNFTSVLTSPMSTNSRGGFLGGSGTPSRRLSVPSSANPYPPLYGQQYGASYGPGPAVQSSSTSSSMANPGNHAYSQPNMPMSPNDDWRRRTWHPSTYSHLNPNYNRPATSGLTYSQTPDAPQPAYHQNAMSAAGQAPRLPGIESFDHVQHRPSTPPRRNVSPPKSLMAAPDLETHRRNASHPHWESPRRSQYPEIDDNGRLTTTWGQDTMYQLDRLRDQRSQRQTQPQPVMGPPLTHHAQQMAKDALDLQQSAPKRVKRSGPGSAYRTSPDSSSSDGIPTPGTSAAEIHPTIMPSNGYIEPQLLAGDAQNTPCLAAPLPVPHQHHSGYAHDVRMASPTRGNGRLEALVAVATATGESNR